MRILIADDHSLVRDGIVSLLEAGGHEVVAQVGDGQAAIEAALRLRPELVLMDISMPVMNGLEALRRIKTKLPEINVVILTVSGDDDDVMDAIVSGAQGYLLKNLSADAFLSSLDGLERGEYALSRQLIARLITDFIDPSRQASAPRGTLTEREVDVLLMVAKGLSNKAISQRLSLSENTVKYYIKQIFRKLDVQNRTEAVTYAMREGLIKTDQ